MGFRNFLIIVGIVLTFGSFYFGDWAIWLGAPLVFMGIILKFLEVTV